MKRGLCLLLSLIILSLTALSFSAFTVLTSGVYQSADSSGAYTVRYNGSHADITRYASQTSSASFDLPYHINAACAYNSRVVLFCNDPNNIQIIVYVYDIDTDVLDSFVIYGTRLYSSTDFCCNDNAIFIENYRDSHELKAYSFTGPLINTYRFDNEITSVFGGYHSGVFAVSGDRLYSLNSNSFSVISGDSVRTPLFPADTDILASVYGDVYILDGSRITDAFSVDSDNTAASACVIGNRLYFPSGNTIYGYDINSGDKVSSYHCSSDVNLLYADGNNVVAVNSTSYIRIPQNDFTNLRTTEDNQADNEIVDISADNPPNNRSVSRISSGVYQVDYEYYRIMGIPPETTFAQFKKNINYDGYTLELYRDNALRKSGNVGTAMTAVFTYGNSSVTFELSVVGDITGEGNCNSRDLTVLMDHLNGAADFNGVYENAADLSGDGIVDVVDLAILKSTI
ncbi:MAG: dockerin type I repeat-containing protein [Ruminococcus sp.]|nr:dockerin type I repeat-containing protein [Ruminococcus sp.]